MLETMEELQSTSQPYKRIAVAKGLPPERGEDGQIHYQIEMEEKSGNKRENGSIDFHERNYIKSVKAGQVLAIIEPPTTPGTQGINIFEEILPAVPGKEVSIVPGDNVEATPDGRQYIAQIDGMVVLKDNRLCLYNIYEIKGDVDFETGNVECNGSVIVKGNVRPTFHVKATGDVVVHGEIDNGFIDCEGNLEVRGGIYNKEDGKIRAGGDIQAHFMVHGKVRARGDISVKGEIFDSEVYAGGHILASGNTGKIIGGSCFATKGIDARQAGSPSYVKTLLKVGISIEDKERLEHVVREMEDLKQKIRKISVIVGRNPTKESFRKIPPGKRPLYLELVKKRNSLVKSYRRLSEEKKKLYERLSMKGGEKIKVQKEVHPEVHIEIRDFSFHVKETLPHVMFYVDPEKEAIVWSTA